MLLITTLCWNGRRGDNEQVCSVGNIFHSGKGRWPLFSYWSRKVMMNIQNPTLSTAWFSPAIFTCLRVDKEMSTHLVEEALGSLWLVQRNRELNREGASRGEAKKRVTGRWWPRTHFTVFSGAAPALRMDGGLTVLGLGQGEKSAHTWLQLTGAGRSLSWFSPRSQFPDCQMTVVLDCLKSQSPFNLHLGGSGYRSIHCWASSTPTSWLDFQCLLPGTANAVKYESSWWEKISWKIWEDRRTG